MTQLRKYHFYFLNKCDLFDIIPTSIIIVKHIIMGVIYTKFWYVSGHVYISCNTFKNERLFWGKVKHESLGVIFDVLFQRAIRILVIVCSWVNIWDLAGWRKTPNLSVWGKIEFPVVFLFSLLCAQTLITCFYGELYIQSHWKVLHQFLQ